GDRAGTGRPRRQHGDLRQSPAAGGLPADGEGRPDHPDQRTGAGGRPVSGQHRGGAGDHPGESAVIEPARFVDELAALGVTFYTGVPDSLLKHLGTHLMTTLPADQHVIAANEGAAVGIAIGHYLRTGAPAVVYLQNSGFGNLV